MMDRRSSAHCSVFLTVAVLLTMVAAPALAQEMGGITGRVLTELSSPIPGAHVRIPGAGIGTITDEIGHFDLDAVPSGTHRLVVSSIGYQTLAQDIRVPRGDTLRITLVMREGILQSPEVVVTASRREESMMQAIQSVSVISADELDLRSAASMDDVLRFVPGVQLQDNQVSVRGSSGFAYNTGSRVLLLLDGMPFLTPDTDGIPFDLLPMLQIEQVEVLKGAGSALYGSGSLGGTIQAVTRDFPEQSDTRVRFTLLGYEPVRHDLWRESWDGADKVRLRSSLSLSHARRTSDKFGFWIEASFRRDAGYLNFSEERVFYGFGKLGYRLSPTVRISLLLGMMERKKDNFLFWNGAHDVLNPGSLSLSSTDVATGAPPNGTNDVVNTQLMASPELTHVVSPQFYYILRGRFYGMGIRPIDNQTGKTLSYSDGTIGARMGGEIQATYTQNNARFLTAGASVDALAAESDFFKTDSGENSGTQPERAVFAQIEERSLEKFTFSAGLRYDHYVVSPTLAVGKASPRAGLGLQLSEKVTLRASYGLGFRAPSLAERYTDNRDFIPIVRNLDLLPEQSKGFEAGGRIAIGETTPFTADVAIFQSDLTNLIEPQLVPDLRAFQFVNVLSARVRGVDASLRLESSELMSSVRLGYTFVDSRDSQLQQDLPFRSRHQIQASVDTRISRHIELGLDFRYLSRPRVVDSDFALFVPDADLLVDTRLVDFRIGYQSGRLGVRVHIRNLFDYYYLERAAYFGAPRRAELQVDLRF